MGGGAIKFSLNVFVVSVSNVGMRSLDLLSGDQDTLKTPPAGFGSCFTTRYDHPQVNRFCDCTRGAGVTSDPPDRQVGGSGVFSLHARPLCLLEHLLAPLEALGEALQFKTTSLTSARKYDRLFCGGGQRSPVVHARFYRRQTSTQK